MRTAPLDVTDDTQVVAAIDRTIAEFGRIDVLVNNAWGGGSMVRVASAPSKPPRNASLSTRARRGPDELDAKSAS